MKTIDRILRAGVLIAGMMSCSGMNGVKSDSHDPAADRAVTIDIPINYTKDSVFVVLPAEKRVMYERYEHPGYDGRTYCVQVVSTDNYVFIDGADSGLCDNSTDLVAHFGSLQYCGPGFKSPLCRDVEGVREAMRGSLSLDSLLESWRSKRDSCKRVCSGTFRLRVK